MKLSRFLLFITLFLVVGLVCTATYAQTTCTGECTVTVVLTPAEIDQARVDDLNAMAGWFLSAIVIVYFGRQLLALFDKDPNES